MKPYRLGFVCGLLFVSVLSGGCGKLVNKLKARDQLNKGVGAFRNAQFQQAIDHFQTAVSLDPDFLNARLYLATAYSQLYIPGGDSAENVKVGEQAIAAFEDVLKMDPNNLTAIASIGSIYFRMHKFDKAKEYQRRRTQLDPNDPEPYYWIGVIDEGVSRIKNTEIRKDLNLLTPNPKGELPPLPEKARAQFENDNTALIDEGIKALQKALELKPNDFDSMAYLNLILRQKADIEKDTDARHADLTQADDWVQKAVGARKQAVEKAASVHK